MDNWYADLWTVPELTMSMQPIPESLRCLPIMRLLDPSIRPVLRAGWLNVLGQFATTAGAGAQLSNHVAAMWLLANGHVFTPVEVLLVWKPCC